MGISYHITSQRITAQLRQGPRDLLPRVLSDLDANSGFEVACISYGTSGCIGEKHALYDGHSDIWCVTRRAVVYLPV